MKNGRATDGFSLIAVIAAVAVMLAGCTGDTGSQGSTGPAGAPGGSSPSTATALTMTITGVAINSPPVVNFTVANESGAPVVGLTGSNLRFTIAKLVPGSNGDPSQWQNYINRVSGGFVQATRETPTSTALVDHGDGTYTYTFATDITDSSKTCPPPCTDVNGNSLDTSYVPSLTHRVAMQTVGALPVSVAIYDFRPSDGATTGLFERLVVDTAKCNECHNQLEHHDARIDTRYCVTCHNPGTTANGKEGTVTGGLTVDFKSMIHKIHRGEDLPSVVAGGDYGIIGFSGSLDSFKDVAFPQDIRNCTKCHDGSDTNTAQGDNWETHPSIQACGSCHDDVYFGLTPTKSYQTTAHPGGVVTDNSECLTCHATNRIAGSIAEAHAIPQKVAAAKFKYNIVSVTGGATPVIQISVTDPTNGNAPYDIAGGDATTNPTFKTPSTSRLALDIGWDTTDFNNKDSGVNPAQPISIDPVNACDGTPISDWSCTVSSGVYTLTKLSALPAAATGTGRVGFEGHPAAPSDPVNAPTVYDMRVPVKSVVANFAITDTTPVPRRQVVDVAKCDKCHDVLSLHGDNRVNEPQLCVMCHNPNDTDVNRRPKNGSGIPDATVTLDGKKEEAIDFKRMIHGIHAAAMTKYDGTAAHGFRDKGLVVYGFGGSPTDFSDVRFPGILNDCQTCHLPNTYTLQGTWETPAQNGILGSTIDTAPTAMNATDFATQLADPADDLNISPTAAVCSSCHDSTVAQAHMTLNGALFNATQTVIGANVESCAVCHGPGRDFDVAKVHAAQ
jgi:OmcA/MtrC family decaheme c-type cytochrome